MCNCVPIVAEIGKDWHCITFSRHTTLIKMLIKINVIFPLTVVLIVLTVVHASGCAVASEAGRQAALASPIISPSFTGKNSV